MEHRRGRRLSNKIEGLYQLNMIVNWHTSESNVNIKINYHNGRVSHVNMYMAMVNGQVSNISLLLSRAS